LIRREKEIKMNKKVILTFDYELFLGKDSGTVEKCIIEPTNIILDLLKRYNAKGIFFVDATYLLKLYENNHKDLKVIENQLCRIIKENHSIELHLHPQWIDSYKINDKRWGFKNFDKYRLSSLKDIEIDRIFKKSITLLTGIIHKVDKKYKLTAFRAGGWSIQPYNVLKKHFINNNILFDFSVNPGLCSSPKSFAYYDFCSADAELNFWKFNDDPCKSEEKGRFIEIPVSTLKVKKIDLWLNYYFNKKKEKQYGDGRSISIKKNSVSPVRKILNIFKLFTLCYSALSVDGLSNKYFKKFLKKYDKKRKKYISVVLHPKKLSENGIKNLKYLIKNYSTIGIEELREELN
jgi:hypothetical protein